MDATVKDPALYESGYDRRENERYFTHPWITNALIKHMPEYLLSEKIWEPAAGRGDMAGVLMDHGYEVFASDIDISEYAHGFDSAAEMDFLGDVPLDMLFEFKAVITNPPYGGGKVDYRDRKVEPSEAFVRKALDIGMDYVAMVLRSEFNSAAGRVDLFTAPEYGFAHEIVLTTRPRWDWWYAEEAKASPRHNFSIFVWDRRWNKPPTQFWEGKPKEKKNG